MLESHASVKMITKTCIECGKGLPTKLHRKYCSYKCHYCNKCRCGRRKLKWSKRCHYCRDKNKHHQIGRW